MFILYVSTRRWKQTNLHTARHISSKVIHRSSEGCQEVPRGSHGLFIFLHWGTSMRMWLAIS
jgi:hypothetical protein